MFVFKTCIWVSRLFGIGAKKSSKVRTGRQLRFSFQDRSAENSLSLAVFAFAVDDINERDLLMTSATPSALLQLLSDSRVRAA